MTRKDRAPIAAETLTAFWDALNSQPAITRPRAAARCLAEQAGRDGWVGLLEIESCLIDAGALPLVTKVSDLLSIFGITPRSVFERPKRGATAVWGYERVEACEAADFLIQVQRLGFDLDPGPLCAAMRPSLSKVRFLTSSQISVFWYARERHRMHPLMLRTGDTWPARGTSDSLSTRTGYTVERQCAANGDTFSLTAIPPPHRRRRLQAGMDVFA